MRVWVAVLVLVAGCTQTFSKPGAKPGAIDRDSTDCEAKMGQAGVASAGIIARQSFMSRCMSGKGWTEE